MLWQNSEGPSLTALYQQTVDDTFVRQAIRRKAASLAGRYGFSLSDRDDIEQELMLDLLSRLHKFNPYRTLWEAFVATQLRLKAHSLIRAALRRQRRGCVSLSLFNGPSGEPSGGSEPTAGHNANNDQLATDVRAAIQSLSVEQQHICRLLSQMSIVDAARDLGITRKALRYRIAALHCRFRELGLAPEKLSRTWGQGGHARRIDKEVLARSA